MNKKREIKFRAWHEEHKLMCEVRTFFLFTNLLLVSYKSKAKDLSYRCCCGDVISSKHIMQYINCKDKNGKEIFEGDIVKRENEILEIVWKSHSFTFAKPGDEEIDEGCVLINPKEWENLEVIGNIYENPKLLKY